MTGDPSSSVADALRAHFGQSPSTASVSFLGVDPIEVLRFEPIPGEWAYLTFGMSRHAMTAATDTVRSADGPRAELMLHVRATGQDNLDAWRQLAVLAAAPAVEGVVYSVGMTVDLGQVIAGGSRCTGVVVTDSAVEDVPTAAGPVRILQVIPATANELAWSRVHGSADLIELWQASGTDLMDLGRGAVALE